VSQQHISINNSRGEGDSQAMGSEGSKRTNHRTSLIVVDFVRKSIGRDEMKEMRPRVIESELDDGSFDTISFKREGIVSLVQPE
jgi:hypothetical protein